LLVGAHDRLGADPLLGFGGADHVDPVEQRFLIDLRLMALIAEAGVGDLQGEVLGHLALVDHPAGTFADLPRGGAFELAALAFDHLLDLGQVVLGALEQLLAFARALGRDRRVATDDQPLTVELWGADLAQPALVKQRELKVGRERQRLDLRRAQGGDEPHALLLEHLDPRFGDHPPVADEHQVLDPEPVLEPLHRR
jgi:hypothetical protein